MAFLSTLVLGCGGGSNGPIATGNPVTFQIAWAERTRAIDAPASAVSATVTLTGAGPNASNLVITVERRADPAAYTQTYASSSTVRPGSYPMIVRFHDRAEGLGHVVASGQATVTIAPDGSGIGSVAVEKKIAEVVVDPQQTLNIGETATLRYTARDYDGALVVAADGEVSWAQIDGSGVLRLEPNGLATGLENGTSSVTVTVKGVTSNPTQVVVAHPANFTNPGFEEPALATPGAYRQNDVPGSSWAGAQVWGISRGQSYWGIDVHAGQQFAYVQAYPLGEGPKHGSIRQTVQGLSIGRTYRVRMWIARRRDIRTGGRETGAAIRVLANGSEIMSSTTPPSDGSWAQVTTGPFVATQSAYQFEVEAILPTQPQDQATLIDDIELVRD